MYLFLFYFTYIVRRTKRGVVLYSLQNSYFPNKGEKVKRANKFETPGDEPNIIVSMTNDGPRLKPKKPGLPRSLETLKRLGITELTAL